MSLKVIAAVAAGGAAGSVLRHLTMARIGAHLGTDFPWGTLAVNVLGSFVMGVLVEVMALVWSTSQEVRALLTVGVLGGFTTFSTFSLDVATLIGRGQHGLAAGYAVASVVASVGGLFLGLGVVRQVMG
ncbi:MAG: fluoride efflux transporter CrcB [Alphaproteobacteria bacterium]|nr:fluoride efflux transporter CrcB [Alphaproteobacteria bacterium]